MRAPPFPQRWIVVQIQATWLKDRIRDFLAGLATQGFKVETMRAYAHRLCSFGEFVEREGVSEPTQLVCLVESFVHTICPPKKQREWRAFLKRFAQFAAPPAVAHPVDTLDPQAQLVEEYAVFLRDHRGLRPRTIRKLCRACTALLAFLAGGGCLDLAMIRPEGIHQFSEGLVAMAGEDTNVEIALARSLVERMDEGDVRRHWNRTVHTSGGTERRASALAQGPWLWPEPLEAPLHTEPIRLPQRRRSKDAVSGSRNSSGRHPANWLF